MPEKANNYVFFLNALLLKSRQTFLQVLKAIQVSKVDIPFTIKSKASESFCQFYRKIICNNIEAIFGVVK